MGLHVAPQRPYRIPAATTQPPVLACQPTSTAVHAVPLPKSGSEGKSSEAAESLAVSVPNQGVTAADGDVYVPPGHRRRQRLDSRSKLAELPDLSLRGNYMTAVGLLNNLFNNLVIRNSRKEGNPNAYKTKQQKKSVFKHSRKQISASLRAATAEAAPKTATAKPLKGLPAGFRGASTTTQKTKQSTRAETPVNSDRSPSPPSPSRSAISTSKDLDTAQSAAALSAGHLEPVDVYGSYAVAPLDTAFLPALPLPTFAEDVASFSGHSRQCSSQTDSRQATVQLGSFMLDLSNSTPAVMRPIKGALSSPPSYIQEVSAHTNPATTIHLSEATHQFQPRQQQHPQQSASIPKHGVTGVQIHTVIEAVQEGQAEARLCKLVDEAPTIVVNMAMLALGQMHNVAGVRKLFQLVVAVGKQNEHTHAMVFQAYFEAGRMDLSLATFRECCQEGQDIGPIGCCMLLKLCTVQRDVDLALELFSLMVDHNMTLNRHAYNCLAHLYGVLGRMDDCISIYRAMQEEESPELRPDGFTFNALVRCINVSQQWKLLKPVFKQLVASNVKVDPEVWCHMIAAAGRSGSPEFALEIFVACKASGTPPTLQIYNALLSGLARNGMYDAVLQHYKEMVVDGLVPDEYTFNALLTAVAQSAGSIVVVEEVLAEMRRWNVKLNTFTGASLINAYRRAPELVFDDPRTLVHILQKADDILRQLRQERLANTQLYGIVATMHAQAGNIMRVFQLLKDMEAQGLAVDGITLFKLGEACQDAALPQYAAKFRAICDNMTRMRRIWGPADRHRIMSAAFGKDWLQAKPIEW